ncbi:serine hydrolase domain-containing protein [Pseudonocardia spinosispora]|uniref:serine hydrolase domain-containing protein n=1 Tax=Pseudonocardia spinosispora TaxID=103441 RepID=UPI001FE19415|nr:serine hydrolase [Pseudonocardia spinosispora]
MSGSGAVLDEFRLAEAIAARTGRWTRAAADMRTYLAAQVTDTDHTEVVGPLLDAGGGSGVVRFAGREVATWGDPSVPEMAFSATKSVASVAAGIAYDAGLLIPEQRVCEVLDLPEFAGRDITWEHLLQQTSQWVGTLWGKPTSADAQSYREGTEVHGTPPGEGWAYNDVRMNLLTYALTVLLGRSLEDVLREEVMTGLGASSSWSWHGYRDSFVTVNGDSVPVVSGGAHWGGGLFISAADLALVGQLYLDGGSAGDNQLISGEWIRRSWAPCVVKPEYGYLWWLNDEAKPWPAAPSTGRGARGNLGRHLLWIDPARDLVLCSRWTEDVHRLLTTVSAAITPGPQSA